MEAESCAGPKSFQQKIKELKEKEINGAQQFHEALKTCNELREEAEKQGFVSSEQRAVAEQSQFPYPPCSQMPNWSTPSYFTPPFVNPSSIDNRFQRFPRSISPPNHYHPRSRTPPYHPYPRGWHHPYGRRHPSPDGYHIRNTLAVSRIPATPSRSLPDLPCSIQANSWIPPPFVVEPVGADSKECLDINRQHPRLGRTTSAILYPNYMLPHYSYDQNMPSFQQFTPNFQQQNLNQSQSQQNSPVYTGQLHSLANSPHSSETGLDDTSSYEQSPTTSVESWFPQSTGDHRINHSASGNNPHHSRCTSMDVGNPWSGDFNSSVGMQTGKERVNAIKKLSLQPSISVPVNFTSDAEHTPSTDSPIPSITITDADKKWAQGCQTEDSSLEGLMALDLEGIRLKYGEMQLLLNDMPDLDDETEQSLNSAFDLP